MEGLNPVIAIEIGNVKSGYAYSLGGQIFTATHGYGLPEDRIPTALLLKSDSSVDSFGTHAKDKYLILTLKKKEDGYQYFEKYSTDAKCEWNTEKCLVQFITFLCERCLNCLNKTKRGGKLKLKDVNVVLTLSGKYNETEKGKMHSAALKAGIKENNLKFVLEIDAAAFYSGHQFLFAEKDASVKELPKGHRFVLVDLGGKKDQYCKYEVLEKNKLKRFGDEVCLNGGSQAVTNKFMEKLELMVGSSNWKKFTEENKFDYMTLRRSFEDCKCNFDDFAEQITLEMPQTFITLTAYTENLKRYSGISFAGEKMIIQWETFLSFYDDSLNKFAKELKKIIESTDEVVLVGGFSQSICARKRIEKKMESNRIVLVPNPDLAVLKGAVMMGCEPGLISDEYGFISIEKVADEYQHCNDTEVLKDKQNGGDITDVKEEEHKGDTHPTPEAGNAGSGDVFRRSIAESASAAHAIRDETTTARMRNELITSLPTHGGGTCRPSNSTRQDQDNKINAMICFFTALDNPAICNTAHIDLRLLTEKGLGKRKDTMVQLPLSSKYEDLVTKSGQLFPALACVQREVMLEREGSKLEGLDFIQSLADIIASIPKDAYARLWVRPKELVTETTLNRTLAETSTAVTDTSLSVHATLSPATDTSVDADTQTVQFRDTSVDADTPTVQFRDTCVDADTPTVQFRGRRNLSLTRRTAREEEVDGIREKNISNMIERSDRLRGRYRKFTFDRNRHLTTEEETALVQYMVYMANQGFPLTRNMARCYIKDIVKQSGRWTLFNLQKGPLDKWFKKLIKRHPELSERKPENQDKARTAMSNKAVIESFFEFLKDVLVKYNVLDKPSQIFNCDETGWSGKETAKAKVFGPKQGHVFPWRMTTTDHITAHLCICADGRFLPTMVIFQGSFPHRSYRDGIPDSWYFGKSDSSYMDTELFYRWFTELFIPHCGRARPVVLLMDNHDSHISLQVVEKAIENDIVLVGFPGHTTHILQPLDVKVIGPLKSRFSETAVNLGCTSVQMTPGKAKLPVVLKYSIDKSTPASIQEAFAVTGICPFNPAAIDTSQLVTPSFAPCSEENADQVTTCDKCGHFIVNPLVRRGLTPHALADVLIPPPVKPMTDASKKKRVVTEGRLISGEDMLRQLKEKEELEIKKKEETEVKKKEKSLRRERKTLEEEERRARIKMQQAARDQNNRREEEKRGREEEERREEETER